MYSKKSSYGIYVCKRSIWKMGLNRKRVGWRNYYGRSPVRLLLRVDRYILMRLLHWSATISNGENGQSMRSWKVPSVIWDWKEWLSHCNADGRRTLESRMRENLAYGLMKRLWWRWFQTRVLLYNLQHGRLWWKIIGDWNGELLDYMNYDKSSGLFFICGDPRIPMASLLGKQK